MYHCTCTTHFISLIIQQTWITFNLVYVKLHVALISDPNNGILLLCYKCSWSLHLWPQRNIDTDLIAVVALATQLPLSWTQSNADVNQLGFQTQDEAKNQRNDNNQHYDNDSSSFWWVNLVTKWKSAYNCPFWHFYLFFKSSIKF